MLLEMKGKFTIRKSKSSRLSYSLVESVPLDTESSKSRAGLMVKTMNNTHLTEDRNKESEEEGDVSVVIQEETAIRYAVDTLPPLPVAIPLAIQYLMIVFGGCAMFSLTISDLVCADINDPIRAKLFCSSVFMVGITTTVQNAVGLRLPMLQGVSGAFLAPILSMKTSGIWKCEDTVSNLTSFVNITSNHTEDYDDYDQEAVYNRVRELQGSLMLAAVFEVLLGATGLVGRLLRFIGPIPVSVTLTSLGVMLHPIAIPYCSTYFPVAASGICLMILFILYIPHVTIPLPSIMTCTDKHKKAAKRHGIPVFKVFPMLLTLILTCAVCFVLTKTSVFPNDKSHSTYRARTDSRLPVINQTPWFYFPYPAQFGTPGFNTAVFIGFITSFVASAVESVGDYIAVSRATEHYPPPRHAINRGIFVEGSMSILSGALGVGHATTSMSETIVLIKITGVASRGVLMMAGCLSMIFGVIGKVGAIMTSVPDPAFGGIMFVQLGMLVAMGLSILQNVNIRSSRNLAVIGVSLYTGLVLSEWIKTNPNSMDTGIRQVDEVLKVVLASPMFTSGVTAIILDNTARGSKEDRGLADMDTTDRISYVNRAMYKVPVVWRLLRKWPILRHLPFLEPYAGED